MKRRIIGILLFALLSLTPAASSVYGQGNGVVIEGNPVGTEGIGSLNPLLCDNPYCRRITDFLFPMLYAVDPGTGLPAPASSENLGLAVDVTAPVESPARIHLRDDLTWSDGTPITAYDVFYSYLAITSQYINSPYQSIRNLMPTARVVDEHTVEFNYSEANCASPARSTFPIVPAHVFDPDFRKTVEDFGVEGNLETWFNAWNNAYRRSRFASLNNHPFNETPSVSVGEFHFDETLPGEEIRLKNKDGEIAFIYRDVESGMDETQFFLNGDSNVLVNPPYENRDDLLAGLTVDPDRSIIETPGDTWNYIAFNLANPVMPRGALDGNGVELEQGQHPIFGDIRIRRAIQMGIDVNELIAAALLGYGTPIASSHIRNTWAANDELPVPQYDPRGAEKLLNEAGWRDVNEDGVRDCVSCLYASQGQSLAFDMIVVSDGDRVVAASLIARQLLSVGIQANIIPTDEASAFDMVRYQTFDALMAGQTERFPLDSDQTALFSRASDVLYANSNIGSYFNPQVDTLMKDALNFPECDPVERANVYRDIQGILQTDQPYIWLYAPLDMLVTRGIVGVAPYANNPFWNIQDWIVVP